MRGLVKCILWVIGHCYAIFRKRTITMPDEANTHWLVNISSGIGDAIMALPMIYHLKLTYPKSQLTLLLNRPLKEIYESHPWIDRIYCVNEYSSVSSFIRLIRKLRSDNFTAYIGAIPSNTLRMVLLPVLSGIRPRIKHQSPHRGCNNFDFLFDHVEKLSTDRHRVECNLDLLKWFEIPLPENIAYPPWNFSDALKREVIGLMQEAGYDPTKPLGAVHAGCSVKAKHKRWPVERYAQLLNHLSEKTVIQILLIGGPDEMEETGQLEKSLRFRPINMAGRINLLQTAYVLTLCRFLISNDSGIMHLATAVQTPVLAIFGPTNGRHIGPYGEGHCILRNGEDVKAVSEEQVYKQIIQSGWIDY